MTQDRQYRHELKYKISYPDYLAMRSRLRPVMKADPHASAGGGTWSGAFISTT